MKTLTPLLVAGLLAAPTASAQIYADVETTLGTFTIEIDYVNSPCAAANFIALAEGTKAWIDSTTGQVRSVQPFYDGIIFHRVIAGFVNQWGSQKGDGSDGPGYRFKDEFSTSNFNSPYKVAMANSGPQTNGSQIFVTVGTPTNLNDVHTIFGTVPEDDGPDGIVDGSRDVVDAINVVTTDVNDKPVTDVTILSVTIRRIGTAAQAFDEHAQELPEVSSPSFTIQNPGPLAFLNVGQGAGTTLQVGLSGDLETWDLQPRYVDAGSLVVPFGFDAGSIQSRTDRHWYTAALVHWPAEAIYPDDLTNRTFVAITAADPNFPFTFNFGPDGVTGTWSYSNPSNPLSGNITDSFHGPDGYGSRLILILSGINYNRWDFRRIGLDSFTPALFNCRQTGTATQTFNPLASPLSISGTSTLSR